MFRYVMKPVLKWIGGKTQIIELIMSKFPKVINNYYEPFLGGGSVLFALLNSKSIKVTGDIIVSDLNEKLIHFYCNIKENQTQVQEHINRLSKEYSSLEYINVYIFRDPKDIHEAMTSQESYYYYMRSLFNSLGDYNTPLASAIFVFLNKTCFRGMYREGPHGFNVPFGHYKTFHVDTLELSKGIQNVTFRTTSFESVFSKEMEPLDFVYVDPPYVKENPHSFVEYTLGGFSDEISTTLFDCIKQTKAKWLMSNSYTRHVLDAFNEKDYTVETIVCKRAINSKNPGSTAKEVLVAN